MDEIRASHAALAGERLRGKQSRRAEIQARFNERTASDAAGEVSRACRWKQLAEIEAELVDGGGPITYLDWNLACLRATALGIGPHTSEQVTPAYAANLAEARQFVRDVLPGFWVTSGLCDLTGHASIGPDYKGPDRERLMREWPDVDRQCRNGWDEDLAPGGEPHRECRAILACAIRALIYRNERA
jgi:hypothetical protein